MTMYNTVIMGFFIMGRAVSVDSEDIKKLSEKIGDVDKRMYHMENFIPELAENIKELTKVVTSQAVQGEFNKNIERRTSQNESEIAKLKGLVAKNKESIWKVVVYLAAGAGGAISISSLFPF
ncbi:TMhelix containing protein [Vibrio phage 1.198.B._10N.286.54.F4]|nr:TMhelix containing protein [Vibrio phage 1.198.A._10N.286.54.F4]AUR94832.1 TMhelix containing protein [Vibrio phage 1.198.B._10N.286.54.F4]